MKQEDCRALETSRRVRKGLDLQHPTSSESCRSSTVDHDEEMTLEPPRKRTEVQEVTKETEWKEARGREEAWMRSKAPTWTPMVKAILDEGKPKITEVEVACQVRKVKKLRARREK